MKKVKINDLKLVVQCTYTKLITTKEYDVEKSVSECNLKFYKLSSDMMALAQGLSSGF